MKGNSYGDSNSNDMFDMGSIVYVWRAGYCFRITGKAAKIKEFYANKAKPRAVGAIFAS